MNPSLETPGAILEQVTRAELAMPLPETRVVAAIRESVTPE